MPNHDWRPGIFALVGAALLAATWHPVAAKDQARACDCPERSHLEGDDLAQSRAHLIATELHLERVLERVALLKSEDPEFQRNLRVSQVAWERCRDAQVSLRWPGEDPLRWGSYAQVIENVERTRLTHRRIHDLLPWVEALQEREARDDPARLPGPRAAECPRGGRDSLKALTH